MQEQKQEYMRRALALAQRGAGHVNPNPMVGCVIVKDGKIIGEGWHEHIGGLHAERNAFAHCTEDCTGADLYVTLEPCPMCAGALINSRMKTVYYGAPDPKAGSCGSMINLFALPYNHQPVLVSGVLEQECADILRNFFRELRKKRKEIRKLEKSRVEEQS